MIKEVAHACCGSLFIYAMLQLQYFHDVWQSEAEDKKDPEN